MPVSWSGCGLGSSSAESDAADPSQPSTVVSNITQAAELTRVETRASWSFMTVSARLPGQLLLLSDPLVLENPSEAWIFNRILCCIDTDQPSRSLSGSATLT